MRKQNEEAREKLDGWSNILNELKFDENKWKKIQEECDETYKNMNEQLKLFQKELFMKNFDLQKNKVIFFEKTNIIFNFKVNFQKLFFHVFIFYL